MNLLPDERKLLSSEGDRLILTDHRIEVSEKSHGSAFYLNIFLEDISTIEVKYSSNQTFFVIAILCVFFGVFLQFGGRNANNFLLISIVLTVVFVALWWASRKRKIIVKPNGGSTMFIDVSSMKKEFVDNFVFKLMCAKQLRMTFLYGKMQLNTKKAVE